MEKLYQNKEYLNEEYINLKKTTYEIASNIGCSVETIRRWLKKFDIPIRSKSEAKTGKLHPMYGKHCSEEHKRKISEALKSKNKIKN